MYSPLRGAAQLAKHIAHTQCLCQTHPLPRRDPNAATITLDPDSAGPHPAGLQVATLERPA